MAKLASVTKLLSRSSWTVAVLLCMLLALSLGQAVVLGVSRMVAEKRARAQTAQPSSAPALSEEEDLQNKIASAGVVFLPDGNAHFLHGITRQSFAEPAAKDQLEVYDARYKLIWRGQADQLPYRYLEWAQWQSGSRRLTAADLVMAQRLGAEFSRMLLFPVLEPKGADYPVVREWWRYDPSARQFVGAGSRGAPLGYLGPAGAADSPARAGRFQPFALATSWGRDPRRPRILWQTPTTVHEIDFAQRRCPLLVDTGADPIESLQTSGGDDLTAKPSRPFLVAVTKGHKAHVLLEEPSERVAFEIPPALRRHRLEIAAASQGVFVRYQSNESMDELAQARSAEAMQRWREKYIRHPMRCWSELFRLDPDGELTPISRVEWVRPARLQWTTVLEEPAAVDWVARALSPGVYGVYGLLRLSEPPLGLRSAKTSRARAVNDWPAVGFVAFDIVTHLAPRDRYAHWILSALLACAALWHGWPRRKSWAGLAGWTALVLLFNLPGLLTYWALNHVPIIRCSSCGRGRGLRRAACRACGAPLPAPRPRDPDLIMA